MSSLLDWMQHLLDVPAPDVTRCATDVCQRRLPLADRPFRRETTAACAK